jgi:hypothetical protein
VPLYVTEFAGQQSGRAVGNTVMCEPAIKTTVMSSGSSASETLLQFTGGTRFVRIASDLRFWLSFGSSTATTGSESSTNSEMMTGNTSAEYRSVQPFGTLIAFST